MFKKIVIVLFLISMTFSCTSMQAVDIENSQEIVSIGDTVELTTTQGKSYKFTVETLTSKQIGGDGFLISINDVLEVKKENFSGVLTTLAIGGGAVVGYIVLYAIALATW
jgi:hypothetical protein